MSERSSFDDMAQSPAVTAFFGSDAMRECFGGPAQCQAWLDVEAALAKAQADLGIIPKRAAASIGKAATLSRLDARFITAETARTAHPIVPLVRALSNAAGKQAGKYVHLGATTQDIMDTGYILLARQGLGLIEDRLATLSGILLRLAYKHRATPMAGRTHGQQALPTTFGLRVAGWHEEVERHIERLAQMRPRLLVGSFGGAAGTLAGYGPQALKLRDRVMAELGLGVPKTSWHANFDRFAECISLFGMIAATGEKLGREVYLLGRAEIGEAFERQRSGQVGSSTMPQKRNPIQSEAVIAAGQLVRAQVAVAQGAMVTQDDRDMGAGMAFWKQVPETFVLLDGLLERIVDVFANWQIDPAAMARNLDLSGGLILSEAVMLRLAEVIGRETAHHAVSQAVQEALSNDRPFADCLGSHPAIGAVLDRKEIEKLLNPAAYLGMATQIVEAIATPKSRKRRKTPAKSGKAHG